MGFVAAHIARCIAPSPPAKEAVWPNSPLAARPVPRMAIYKRVAPHQLPPDASLAEQVARDFTTGDMATLLKHHDLYQHVWEAGIASDAGRQAQSSLHHSFAQ